MAESLQRHRVESEMASLQCPPRDLPNEILLTIIQLLPRCDLKHIRLVSRAMNCMSEAQLFRKVVLVPNLECLNGFAAMMSSSKVARHVQKLVYDGRHLQVFYDRGAVERQQLLAGTAIDFDTVDRVLLAASDDRLMNPEDTAVEAVLLNKIFSTLPALRQVEAHEFAVGDISPWPAYFHQVCKRAKIDISHLRSRSAASYLGIQHTKAVLLALAACDGAVHDFTARNLQWEVLFGQIGYHIPALGKELTMYKTMLPKLQKLELTFSTRSSEVGPPNIETFGRLITTAVELKDLTLRVTNNGVERFEEDLMPDESFLKHWLTQAEDGKPCTQPVFPKLKSLSLESILCREDDLVRFMRLHSTTLRHLELANISLAPNIDEEGLPCWVRVLKTIRSDMRLKSVSFANWFSNSGRQQWYVRRTAALHSSSSSLKNAVESWIVNRTASDPCPLEQVVIKPGEVDVLEPAAGEREIYGDASWQMTYPVMDDFTNDDDEGWQGDEDEEEDEEDEEDDEYIIFDPESDLDRNEFDNDNDADLDPGDGITSEIFDDPYHFRFVPLMKDDRSI